MLLPYTVGDEPIAGYRLVEFIGRGGFGEVWKAIGPGGIETALKIIELKGRGGIKEFQSLHHIKNVRHPNLTQITAFWLKADSGQILDGSGSQADRLALLSNSSPTTETVVSDEGFGGMARPRQLIIAMGLGDKSLSDRLEECRAKQNVGIPPDELLDYMEGAARAIDFLNSPRHELGEGPVAIHHRDIKPQNILIVGDAVQVCDFGLAGPLSDITVTGYMGSPAYSAPECIDQNRPTPSSDQYSLAISYVELRTGELPFAPGTEDHLMRVMQAHLEGKLDLSRLPSDDERDIIARATSRDPEKRFATALKMVRALRRACEGSSPGRAADERTRRRVVPRRPAPGLEMVPGYRLKEHVARGATTEVWSARAPGGKSEALLIRNLRPFFESLDLDALALIANLDEHPHLAELHGFWLLDEQGNELPTETEAARSGPRPDKLIMADRLAPSTVFKRLEECRRQHGEGIPAEELCEYLGQVAEAVDCLNAPKHELDGRLVSIVHNNLRPVNLLLFGRSVKLGNFARAKVIHGDSMRRPVAESEFEHPFTAPELFEGLYTCRSDQYSLAIVYVQLRTGQLPFDASSSTTELIAAQKQGALDLSKLETAEAEIIGRATSLAWQDRFVTCCAMIDALRDACGLSEDVPPAPTETPLPMTEGLTPPLETPDGGLEPATQRTVKSGTLVPDNKVEAKQTVSVDQRARKTLSERPEAGMETPREAPPPATTGRRWFGGLAAAAAVVGVAATVWFVMPNWRDTNGGSNGQETGNGDAVVDGNTITTSPQEVLKEAQQTLKEVRAQLVEPSDDWRAAKSKCELTLSQLTGLGELSPPDGARREQLQHGLRLASARCLARQNDWPKVKTELDNVEGEKLNDQAKAHYDALSTLAEYQIHSRGEAIEQRELLHRFVGLAGFLELLDPPETEMVRKAGNDLVVQLREHVNLLLSGLVATLRADDLPAPEPAERMKEAGQYVAAILAYDGTDALARLLEAEIELANGNHAESRELLQNLSSQFENAAQDEFDRQTKARLHLLVALVELGDRSSDADAETIRAALKSSAQQFQSRTFFVKSDGPLQRLGPQLSEALVDTRELYHDCLDAGVELIKAMREKLVGDSAKDVGTNYGELVLWRVERHVDLKPDPNSPDEYFGTLLELAHEAWSGKVWHARDGEAGKSEADESFIAAALLEAALMVDPKASMRTLIREKRLPDATPIEKLHDFDATLLDAWPKKAYLHFVRILDLRRSSDRELYRTSLGELIDVLAVAPERQLGFRELHRKLEISRQCAWWARLNRQPGVDVLESVVAPFVGDANVSEIYVWLATCHELLPGSLETETRAQLALAAWHEPEGDPAAKQLARQLSAELFARRDELAERDRSAVLYVYSKSHLAGKDEKAADAELDDNVRAGVLESCELLVRALLPADDSWSDLTDSDAVRHYEQLIKPPLNLVANRKPSARDNDIARYAAALYGAKGRLMQEGFYADWKDDADIRQRRRTVHKAFHLAVEWSEQADIPEKERKEKAAYYIGRGQAALDLYTNSDAARDPQSADEQLKSAHEDAEAATLLDDDDYRGYVLAARLYRIRADLATGQSGVAERKDVVVQMGKAEGALTTAIKLTTQPWKKSTYSRNLSYVYIWWANFTDDPHEREMKLLDAVKYATAAVDHAQTQNGHFEAQRALGNSYEDLGWIVAREKRNADLAENWFGDALTAHAKSKNFDSARAMARFDFGRAAYRSVVERYHNPDDAQQPDDAEAQRRKLLDAREALEQATEPEPGLAGGQAYYFLAKVDAQLGDDEAAAKAFKRALEHWTGPRSRRARWAHEWACAAMCSLQSLQYATTRLPPNRPPQNRQQVIEAATACVDALRNLPPIEDETSLHNPALDALAVDTLLKISQNDLTPDDADQILKQAWDSINETSRNDSAWNLLIARIECRRYDADWSGGKLVTPFQEDGRQLQRKFDLANDDYDSVLLNHRLPLVQRRLALAAVAIAETDIVRFLQRSQGERSPPENLARVLRNVRTHASSLLDQRIRSNYELYDAHGWIWRELRVNLLRFDIDDVNERKRKATDRAARERAERELAMLKSAEDLYTDYLQDRRMSPPNQHRRILLELTP